ncbi:MAG: isoprenylcysteine carboxylmethyltransferase family protein [Candidatus Thiodiazotropha sp. (ex Dulcina madagascariensis)]|nr:isoprenylcysteine carboxylmethyltransferase family protein [Candidatus Thiodiazotropha sp. (ex Epidulcina cf. delphinae)]MCU7925200.1 isoprenylcysteine carboxylmethyltransferase family protein [Candidatus Thiodiazotropha sp. (ex Dulcina madagascariensis)]MCU7933528.1 isoprenylcysteine carboxylmethyltransferase family protein [Candidatus Thiodiazotropha sp. (ex Dulcina madagascariensis)]
MTLQHMGTRKTGSVARLLTASITGLVFFAAIIFWPAGRIDWIEGWLYFGLVTTNLLINFVYLRRINPEVIEHRLRLGKGTKLWDKLWSVFFTPAFLAIYVIAGFDAVRFEWSTMPWWLWPLGFALWLPGNILFTWSMGVNPFFEKTVRIQTERGHRVIDTGPYSYVRHPGYLGFLGWSLSTPLFLGSWWAFLPALLSIVLIVIRAALEDRTLHEELTGYRDYANRVPYRLIPGIW